jgi:hypothetical protein
MKKVNKFIIFFIYFFIYSLYSFEFSIQVLNEKKRTSKRCSSDFNRNQTS